MKQRTLGQSGPTVSVLGYGAMSFSNFYGPADLTTAFAKSHPAVLQFLGKPYEQAATLYEKASPIRHLDPTDPPTLVLHGTLDEVVPVTQSDALVEKLKTLGIPHEYDRLQGWPHSMDVAQTVFDRSVWLMDRFLKTHLSDQRMSQNRSVTSP